MKEGILQKRFGAYICYFNGASSDPFSFPSFCLSALWDKRPGETTGSTFGHYGVSRPIWRPCTSKLKRDFPFVSSLLELQWNPDITNYQGTNFSCHTTLLPKERRSAEWRDYEIGLPGQCVRCNECTNGAKSVIHFFGVLVVNKLGYFTSCRILQYNTEFYCVILRHILLVSFPDMEKLS